MKIFISHIHEEAKLGAILKAWIEDAFTGQVAVFLSSDPRDLPGGRKWLDDIHAGLRDEELKILLSLISPESLRRPWISIELGAAWIQDKMVIPLCHSGMRKGELPRPLGDFVAIELEAEGSAKRLLDAIASALKLKYATRLHLEQMRAEALEASEGLAYAELPPTAPQQADPQFDEEEIRILQTLCYVKDGSRDGDGDILLTRLAAIAKVPVAKLEWRLERLIEEEYARDSYHGEGRHFSIRERGTAALLKLGKYPGIPAT